MNRWESTLTLLETRLQQLIEGNLARLFPAVNLQNELVQQLVAAMQADICYGADGVLQAPDQFTIFMPSVQAQEMIAADSLEELCANLVQAAGEAGIAFPRRPTIRVMSNPESSAAHISIVAQFSLKEDSGTVPLWHTSGNETAQNAPRAFMIVDGTQHFPLEGMAVNIGCQADNHLVIVNGSVLPYHAQVRVIKGSYVIFDLSSGDLTINGVKISQSILYPGDVIALGGVHLVFGEEPFPKAGNTQKIIPAPG
jgi:hypothetical protein